jgi:hypothetical protein
MTKSGCLALLLLLSGSIAAAAAVSEPQQTAPRSLQAGAARSDNATRTAMVYCDIKHWHSNKCMGHKLFHCDNLEDHNCKVTSKCQMYYPTKNALDISSAHAAASS